MVIQAVAMNLPRPRGTNRVDDLLSLNDAAIGRRDVLIMVTYHMFDACLVGNPAPKVAEKLERIEHPQPGDLVVEHSVPHSRRRWHRLHGFGLLLATRTELISDEDDEPYTEQATYVQYGPAADDVCRWIDCKFIAIPREWWQL